MVKIKKILREAKRIACQVDHAASKAIHQTGKQLERTGKQVVQAAKAATRPKQLAKQVLGAALTIALAAAGLGPLAPAIATGLSDSLIEELDHKHVTFKSALKVTLIAAAGDAVNEVARIPVQPVARAVVQGSGRAIIAKVAKTGDPVRAFFTGAAKQAIQDWASERNITFAEECLAQITCDMAIASVAGDPNVFETPMCNLTAKLAEQLVQVVQLTKAADKLNEQDKTTASLLAPIVEESKVFSKIYKEAQALVRLVDESDYEYTLRQLDYKRDEYYASYKRYLELHKPLQESDARRAEKSAQIAEIQRRMEEAYDNSRILYVLGESMNSASPELQHAFHTAVKPPEYCAWTASGYVAANDSFGSKDPRYFVNMLKSYPHKILNSVLYLNADGQMTLSTPLSSGVSQTIAVGTSDIYPLGVRFTTSTTSPVEERKVEGVGLAETQRNRTVISESVGVCIATRSVATTSSQPITQDSMRVSVSSEVHVRAECALGVGALAVAGTVLTGGSGLALGGGVAVSASL